MPEPIEDDLIAAIDRRALELIAEMRRYTAEVQQDDPATSDRDAFECWAIQKLAGFQVLVERLNARLDATGCGYRPDRCDNML